MKIRGRIKNDTTRTKLRSRQFGDDQAPAVEVELTPAEQEILVGLLKAVIHDVSYLTGVCLNRDIKTITERLRHEGFSFVTKTLPVFSKAVLSAFRTGEFQTPGNFTKRPGTALPRFLGGLLELLFSRDGKLLPSADATVVWGVLQICSMFYKYKLPHSWRTDRDAIQRMVDVETTLPRSFPLDEFSMNTKKGFVLFIASEIARNLLSKCDLKEIVPKHGPGSTATGMLPQYAKYNFSAFDGHLETYYPFVEYTAACPQEHSHRLEILQGSGGDTRRLQLDYRNPIQSTSRVVCVPKDSRGPRIISAESKERMWIQQGQGKTLVDYLENHRLTRGQINFTDQDVNGDLAISASQSGIWATLDMKEASDRCSYALVKTLLPDHIFDPLNASRSDATTLQIPIGTEKGNSSKIIKDELTIGLKKFAPMGSAVCFPVESLIFWLLCVAVIVVETRKDPIEAAKLVYVYGDDIIVPVDYVPAIIEVLEAYGLEFNRDKSYWTGPFRESCGKDGFKGENITTIKVKNRLPRDCTEVENVVSWVELSNNLHLGGCWQSAAYIIAVLARLPGSKKLGLDKLPVLPPEAGCLGWVSFCGDINPDDPGWIVEHDRTTVKPKFEGSTFLSAEMREEVVPFYQGKIWKRAIFTKSKIVIPDESEFTERSAYLRWMTTNVGRKDGSAINVGSSSRVFGERYAVSFKLKPYIFS